MEAAGNADSDHSLTWEDFYGSTTDLTPTLIGIFNSYLDPSIKSPAKNANSSTEKLNVKPNNKDEMKEIMEPVINNSPSKDPRLIAGGVRLPGLSNEVPTVLPVPENKKSPTKMSYVSRLKNFSLIRKNSDPKEESSECEQKSDTTKLGANECSNRLSEGKENVALPSLNSDSIKKINCEVIAKVESNRKQWSERNGNSFDVLSPNVKRMLSSVGEDGCSKSISVTQPKKPNLGGPGRYSGRLKHSNIPLVGTTSKITSSAEIGSVIEVYDKPSNPTAKSNPRCQPTFSTQSSLINRVAKDWTPTRQLSTFSTPKKTSAKPEEIQPTVYDVPVSSAAIYDVPVGSRKVTETDNLSQTERANKTSDSTTIDDRKNQITPKANGDLLHPKISGSTGDLKSVNQPGADENRLDMNQVVRPLSMSSIASSTSTSSSGAQNKGGANSAYLASIESLDDHSDMDTSLAYANKTSRLILPSVGRDSVDNAESLHSTELQQGSGPGRPLSPPRPRYCDPNLSLLQRVCIEIVDTENIYVEDLRQVVEGYLYSWRERGTFSPEQLNDLFGNMEEIYHFNKKFSHRLNDCNLEAVAIARCFVNHSSGFNIYTDYCTGYPGIMAALSKLLRAPDSAQPFRSQQTTLGHALPLGSYLLKPVQRILKYHLLLQNLVKQYKSHDTEYALHKMTLISHHINDMKRRHEDAVRVQEIQSLLYGWNGQDLTTFGELCAEGTFRVFGAKAMRHAFLFDKMLLLTKNKEYGMLAYKSHIMCNNLMLVESIQGQPLSFHVIPYDCPRMQVTLQARSIQHKREWTLLLKRAMLENYNVAIPSHARQLVMELGQNKTDDDIIAEKSSTLMSHSSMRKQLSAPEYLEKRKLDRDRRKSFDSGLRHRLKKPQRKTTVCNNMLENDESEKELKDDDSNYICPDCINTSNSTLSICKDCAKFDSKDMLCNNCSKNYSKCSECKNYMYSSNDNIPVDQSNYLCQKCTNAILNSSSNYSSMEILPCEKCNIPKCATAEMTKNIYDRLNDKNKLLDMKKTCLKCHHIRENIVMTNNGNCSDSTKRISKDDMQTLKVPKLITPRRKSEPGIVNMNFNSKDSIKDQCTVCGKKCITCKSCGTVISNKNETENSKQCKCDNSVQKDKLEKNSPVTINMYNAKTVPKKISKIKKNRAKTLRHLALDPTAKFYTDFTNDFASDNVLHISESTDSLNTLNSQTKYSEDNNSNDAIEVPHDIDEEMYRNLIQKTDSFKKSEIERDKLASQTKQQADDKDEDEKTKVNSDHDETFESCDDGQNEKPLEQIISQLLMQNREFQKILKKHQTRNASNRRHQRLLKSYSNPEKLQNKELLLNIRPKYGRQTSECTNITQDITDNNKTADTKDDHIYEALVIKTNKNDDASKHSTEKETVTPKPKHIRLTESDYVYLSFDGQQNINAYKIPDKINYEDDGQYAVPNITPKKVEEVIEIRKADDEYDNSSEIWKRISNNTVIENKNYKTDYSDTDGESQSPNLPMIWLNRQKEHFSTPREKKSGSLPRSFQMISNTSEQIPIFNKVTNKLYLNKDGKVLQTDRPFTIASDHSEISYEDIERFIKVNDNSELKFPQNLSESFYSILESDILDTKSQFEDQFRDKLEVSSVLDYSISSSMEVMNEKVECETSQEDINNHHPEHKVYKPNMFKSVFNKFKSSKNKSLENINVEQEKKTSPKSNGRSLLQRLKSMRSDETEERAAITVLVTSADETTTNNQLTMSNSFCGGSDSNKAPIDSKSKSFLNISSKASNISQSVQHVSSGVNNLKVTRSNQELNKLPIYKQGSNLLGARIAQSDYADPKLLMTGSNTDLIKVNILINKTSIRPDSVLSNSSHFTSSSDGCFSPEINKNASFLYKNVNKTIPSPKSDETKSDQLPKINITQSDESFFEKSFEEIENIYCNEIFRDSAIYSDPDDGSCMNDIDIKWTKTTNTITKPIITPKAKENVKQDETPPKIIQSRIPSPGVKLAPPVPAKPVINKNTIPSFKQQSIKTKMTTTNLIKNSSEENSTNDSINKIEVASPEKLKLSIPRPNYQRTTSSNINIKRMSFERCSLDSSSINRRSNNPPGCKPENSEEISITKSVQERKNDIEKITDEIQQNRRSLDKLEFNRSFSMKMSNGIRSPVSSPTGNSTFFPKSRCNIPRSTNASDPASLPSPNIEENLKGGWVKQVVNRFQ